MSKVSELIGKTLTSIKGQKGDDEMILETADGKRYIFWHEQDCCESVTIEDVIGDLNDLLGEPLVEANEVASSDHDPEDYAAEDRHFRDSFTWTFYKLGTRKGSVTIRWYAESNGYYSEYVDFREMGA